MLHLTDLPPHLSLFPLPGALLLPRSPLPLHIFEPRYLAMIEDCMKTPQRLIGMIQPLEENSEKALHQIGCAGRLTAFTETADGRYMISLTGISRFRILREVDSDTPYRRAEVDWTPFTADRSRQEERDPQFDRKSFLDLLGRYFSQRQLATDWQTLQDAETEMLINALSMLCPLPPEDKQALLEAPTLAKRREVLAALIEFALRSGGSSDEVMQ